MEPGRPHRCLMESSWNERSPGLVASQWNHPWEVSSVSSYLKWGQYFLSGIIAIRTWHIHNQFSSFQSLSCVWLFMTPWTIARQASLSITNSRSLPKPMFIVSVMPSNHLILSSPSPPALKLTQHQGLFKWVSSPHQVAKVLEFQLQNQSLQWTPRTDLL